MKKIITIAAFMIAGTSLTLQAQDDYQRGFYIKPSGSYFFKVAPVEFPTINGNPARDRDFIITGNGQSIQRDRTLTGSFGEGWRASLLGGYRFNRYVGLELGLNYFAGAEQDMTRMNGTFQNGAIATSLYIRGKVTAFDVAPALVLHIPTNGPVKPYTKVGIIIPVGGNSETHTSLTDYTGQAARAQGLAIPQAVLDAVPTAVIALTDVERIDKSYSNPTVGFQAALGFDYWLSEKLSIFAELEYRNVTVGSKKKELESISGNFVILNQPGGSPIGAPGTSGTLSYETASESSRTVNYHKEINASEHNFAGSGNFDPNQAADDVQNRISFGGLGFSIGLKIPFGR